MSYIGQVLEGVYPRENRVLAGVAALRTFKQTIKSAVVVAAGGGIASVPLAATNTLPEGVTIATIAIGVGLLLLNAFVAAAVAWDDVAQNGLTPKYAEAVEEEVRGRYGNYEGETSEGGGSIEQ